MIKEIDQEKLGKTYFNQFRQSYFQPDSMLSLYLVFEEAINGYKLLEHLIANNLRHGYMKLFHYYEMDDGFAERIVFSVAKSTQPGGINLENIGELSCDGLSFFMPIHEDERCWDDFKLMYSMAQKISKSLGGQIKDEQGFDFTDRVFLDYKEKIALKA